MEKPYSLGLYEKALPPELSWKEKMEVAKRCHFDFLEISIDETDEKLARLDMSQGERSLLANTVLVMGFPIGSMCLSGHRKYPLGSRDPATEKRSLQIMAKAIALAGDLGIRIIQLAGYDVYYEESDEQTRKRFMQNLQICVSWAAKQGVILAFETMETPFLNTVGKAMAVVRQIDSPYLQIYPDLGNITNAVRSIGGTVLSDLQSGKGHIAGMHLKETVEGQFRNLLFGEGGVDFPSGIREAWELGVRRYVTEFWYQGNPEWEADVLFAHDFVSAYLDKEC
ncbi:L-ribulose-5-phosphate 3-epimerase [uncultured Sphaerochaeta sp.]|uniref:L-ribulose-5-phosphate 3-epimerase n=1 Tax=uncultured Sphaerochaeta sp. TaxID=886478 RepID=UPI002A0A74D6|nr:L-ribulose-5-phosphate 3-epimerase [uncultured Sphaerochaeta sp.]